MSHQASLAERESLFQSGISGVRLSSRPWMGCVCPSNLFLDSEGDDVLILAEDPVARRAAKPRFLKRSLLLFQQFHTFPFCISYVWGKWKIEGESRMSYNSNFLTLQLDGNLPNGITICSQFNSIIDRKLGHRKGQKSPQDVLCLK